MVGAVGAATLRGSGSSSGGGVCRRCGVLPGVERGVFVGVASRTICWCVQSPASSMTSVTVRSSPFSLKSHMKRGMPGDDVPDSIGGGGG